MQTHYRRLKPQASNRLNSPEECALYQALPADRLMVAEDIYGRMEAECRKEGVRMVARKGFENMLADLVTRGFVKEVYGLKLARWLESF